MDVKVKLFRFQPAPKSGLTVFTGSSFQFLPCYSEKSQDNGTIYSGVEAVPFTVTQSTLLDNNRATLGGHCTQELCGLGFSAAKTTQMAYLECESSHFVCWLIRA